MLDLAEHDGVIGPEARKAFERDFYVPFYRVIDRLSGPGTQAPGGRKRGIANQTSGIKRLTGGEAPVNDLVENMALNMLSLLERSMKNYAMQQAIPHVGDRVDIWLDPWSSEASGAGQIQQSLFAQADGGLFGQGLGESLPKLPGPFAPDCAQPFPDCGSILPAPHTDEIYAVLVSDLGLFGGAAVVAIYALITARGLKTAVMARDGFSKLLAAGLTAVFALQAVVIIGVSLRWLASPVTTFERRGSRQRRVRGSWGYPPDRACST